MVLSVYFFFHAYQITPEKYDEKNFISIPMAYAKSLIPTLVISFLITISIALFREQSLRASIALWLPFPIYTAVVHQILKLFFTTPAFQAAIWKAKNEFGWWDLLHPNTITIVKNIISLPRLFTCRGALDKTCLKPDGSSQSPGKNSFSYHQSHEYPLPEGPLSAKNS